jgi:spermidine/putrescine transport system ATP-binding protein
MQQQIGITFIYVTHDQEEALTMSDRLGIMSEGKLLQVGTPRDIYDHPSSLFVADFIGEANILSGRVIKQINQGVVVLVENKFAIPVAFPEELSVDTLVNLVIRPEKIEIHPNNNDSESTYSGEIQEIIYLGNDTKYVIKTNDILLTVRQQNLYSNFCTKESVKIKIAPQHISLLPKG